LAQTTSMPWWMRCAYPPYKTCFCCLCRVDKRSASTVATRRTQTSPSTRQHPADQSLLNQRRRSQFRNQHQQVVTVYVALPFGRKINPPEAQLAQVEERPRGAFHLPIPRQEFGNRGLQPLVSRVIRDHERFVFQRLAEATEDPMLAAHTENLDVQRMGLLAIRELGHEIADVTNLHGAEALGRVVITELEHD